MSLGLMSVFVESPPGCFFVFFRISSGPCPLNIDQVCHEEACASDDEVEQFGCPVDV